MRTPLQIPATLKALTYGINPGRTVVEWSRSISEALESSALIEAYNLSVEALADFPDDLGIRVLASRSLIACDALEEAKLILNQSVVDPHEIRRTISRSIQNVNRILKSDDLNSSEPSHVPDLVASWTSRELDSAAEPDVEAIGALARVHKSLWESSGNTADLRHAYELYDYGFERTGSYWLGVNAATLARVSGEQERSEQLAYQTLLQIELSPNKADHWSHATRGEAFLLLGQYERSVAEYERAKQAAGSSFGPLASMRRQLRLLANNGIAVPQEIWDSLRPPAIVAFTGHRIDEPGRETPRFPESREAEVQSRVREVLDRIDAKIGYVGAACGADIIFIEQMLERGGEVNILMPFCYEDFIQQSVAYAGSIWRRRFDQALRSAHSVTYITEEPSLGANLFQLLGKLIVGLAELRADAMETKADLVAVSDMIDRGLQGSPIELIQAWPEPERLHVISIGESAQIREEKTAPAEPSGTAADVRRVRTFLFCDVCGYSRLQEHMQPLFIHKFMARIAEQVGRPAFVNTGGDSLFVSMDEAMPLANFGLDMLELIANENWAEHGLESGLTMRIALHVGPAFELIDPFTGKLNLYGSHVNRAARMEPVAIPGHVYASDTFVALLRQEELARREPTTIRKKYLGYVQLPKNFGHQSVYSLSRMRLRRAEDFSDTHAERVQIEK